MALPAILVPVLPVRSAHHSDTRRVATAAWAVGESVTIYLHHPTSSLGSYVNQHYHSADTSEVTSPNIITRQLHHPTSSQGSYITQHYLKAVTSPIITTRTLHHPKSSLGSYITQHHHKAVTIYITQHHHKAVTSPTSPQGSYITQHHHKEVTSPKIISG